MENNWRKYYLSEETNYLAENTSISIIPIVKTNNTISLISVSKVINIRLK